MRIAIVGAGAMGYLFAYLLTREKKADVWILDIRPDSIIFGKLDYLPFIYLKVMLHSFCPKIGNLRCVRCG